MVFLSLYSTGRLGNEHAIYFRITIQCFHSYRTSSYLWALIINEIGCARYSHHMINTKTNFEVTRDMVCH